MTIAIQLTRQREETGAAATDLNKTSTIEKSASADQTDETSATSATATKALPSMVEVPGACEEREVCVEVVAALAASSRMKGDLDATLTIVMRETSKTSRKSLKVAGAQSEAACAEAIPQVKGMKENPCGVAEAVVEGTIAGQTCAAELTSTLHPDGASTERTSSMTEAVNSATTTTLPSKEKEEMTINNVIREET